MKEPTRYKILPTYIRYRILPTHIRYRTRMWKQREYDDSNKESQNRKISEQSRKNYIFLASKQEIHMNEFDVGHNNPIFETVYQQLKSIPTDSSTPTSPVPNKTDKHTIPHGIPH
jgi:hypothetical protein